MKSRELALRIYDFLDKYAVIRPDFDPKFDDEGEKYTSPDAHMLKCCADMLTEGLCPTRCWSDWGSGGYRPYTSSEGRKEHDELVKAVSKIIQTGG